MYDEFYGLTGRPFQLTPDPRFWFDTATHKKAMAYLGYGLSQGEGFIVITGDIGAGKTTLVGHLVDTVDPERLNIIKIVSTQIAADDLLRTVCAGLDVAAEGLSKAQMLGAIERGLHAVARSGRRTLLIVDEAQALPVDSLEELRMLSNFQAGGYALLQIFLLGQPEFRDKLADAALEQLRQRVIAMHHLGPMEADELEPYLVHRLSVVDWSGRPRFKTDALATIYAWSGGIPRRINQLVSRVLLHGALEGIDTFTAADIDMVIRDLDTDGMKGADSPPPADVGMARSAPAQAASAEPEMTWPFVVAGDATEPVEAENWRPIAVDPPEEDIAGDPVPEAPVVAVPEIESAGDDAEAQADDVETRPAAISAPPQLFDRISLRGRRSLLAPVDPAPVDAEPAPHVVAPAAIVEPTPAAEPPAVAPAAIVEPTPAAVADAPEPEVPASAPVIDLDVARRLADIDRRLEDQDVALRRVLTLLVDWVEGGGARPDFSGLHDKVG